DRGKPTNGRRSGRDTDRAMAELRERYARGELSDEEFEQRRRTLERR
ncbi:MAG: putative membrane protein, partial [Halobacteriales archaeon]